MEIPNVETEKADHLNREALGVPKVRQGENLVNLFIDSGELRAELSRMPNYI